MRKRAALAALLAGGVLVAFFSVRNGSGQRPIVGEPQLLGRVDTLALLPPQQIRPTVSVRVAIEESVNGIMLELLVGNEANAQQGIQRFGVANVQTPLAQLRPAQWLGMYGYDGNDSAFVWACVDTITEPPGDNPLYPSPYAIDPGDTLHTFQVYLPQLPAVLTYYAQGFSEAADMAEMPTIFESGWTGSIDLRGISLSVPDKSGQPKLIELTKPTPNPVRSSMDVGFSLPNPAKVRLVVIDVAGRAVRTLKSGRQDAGVHAVTWTGANDSGRRCAPGTYFIRLYVDEQAVGAQKVVLLK